MMTLILFVAAAWAATIAGDMLAILVSDRADIDGPAADTTTQRLERLIDELREV